MQSQPRARDLLHKARIARDAGNNAEYVLGVLQAIRETALLRHPDKAVEPETAFVLFLREEWPVLVAGVAESDERYFKGESLRVAEILHRVLLERESTEGISRTTLVLTHDDHMPEWFEPEPDRLICSRAWFDRLEVVVEVAPENFVAEDRYPPPEQIMWWKLFHQLPDVSNSLLVAYWQERERKLGPIRDKHDALAAAGMTTVIAAYEPTATDELAYQIINLRLLCQMYSQGMRTFYKPAAVSLRTLLFGSSGQVGMAELLPNPQLPQLAVTSLIADGVHMTVPSRLKIGAFFAAAGAGMLNVNIEGGAVNQTKLGSLFSNTMMPLRDWLKQPFLEPSLTLEGFLKHIAHKDGGAHFEDGHKAVAKYERFGSLHWSLTIKIGEAVAESLWAQFEKANPGYVVKIP